MNRLFKRLFVLCWIIPTLAMAQSELSLEQQSIVDNALREMLVDISSDPAFAEVDWSQVDALIARRPETFRQFGAVLNANLSADVDAEGVEVLAVSPGLMADQMGLLPMDRITHINQISLLNRGVDDETRSQAYRQFVREFSRLNDGVSLDLQIRRNGNSLALRGSLELQTLPRVRLEVLSDATSMQQIELASQGSLNPDAQDIGCGSINSRQAPPHAGDIFPVVITGINTTANEIRQREVVYLTPGTYRVRLQDYIPHYELRSKHTRFTSSRPSKELTVTVDNGQVYYLGAKLLYSIKNQADQDDYWEPIVWKTEALDCLGSPVTPDP